MFNGNTGVSLADIAAVTNGNRNNNGWGGDGDWWAWIILFAMFGWGNGGFGFGNGGGASTTAIDAALQRGFDTQTMINKLDGINNGLCSLGYDQLAQMNNINSTVMQTGFGLQQSINDNTVAGMQNTNALQALIQSCCCDMRSGLKDLQYTMATDTCALKNEVHQTGDAIIQNANWNARDLNDTIRQGFENIQRQNDQRYIAELERKLNACDRDSALQGLSTYLINTLRPSPIPSYRSCNPWAYNGGNWDGCNGCGSCGNN